MNRSKLPPPATSLDAYADPKKGEVNVVIEATRGTRNKYKYDEETRLFKLSKVLPSGCAFPLDFGFVPGTLAEDGDPLDILLFSDEPLVVGTLLPARLLGVLEAAQKEEGKTERNDRLVGVGTPKGQELQGLKTLKDIPKVKIEAFETFFVAYNAVRRVEFRILGLKGPEAAARILRRACARFRDENDDR